MKKKKREEIVETILMLGKVRTYSPADLGADSFIRVNGAETDPELRCVLMSTIVRDKIIKLLGERL